ncbi:MAG: hypothetical protein KDK70_33715, partial [Myxococcales bacterium]|nr:hypothetical protein [Myxococcales bacterium]
MHDERDERERGRPWRWLVAGSGSGSGSSPRLGRWLAATAAALTIGLVAHEYAPPPLGSLGVTPCAAPSGASPSSVAPRDASAGPVERAPAAGPVERAPAAEAEAAPRLTAVRVWPDSDAQRAELVALARDVWSEHGGPALDVVLDPEGLAVLRARSIAFTELVPDVVAVARAEHARLSTVDAARPVPPERWFDDYRDLETIHAYLDELAQARPDLVEASTLGHSLQGRPLRVLRIHGTGTGTGTSTGTGTGTGAGTGSPGVSAQPPARMLIDGGLHAREWISMMVATCVADRLVRGYDDDARLRRFVDEVELWVLPVANPDGYVHSWQRDRYWRKNRRGEHGVDLNRNFGLAWGGEGSSDNPASQVYRGEAPFSEPESAAIRALLESRRFDAHVDFHSYGQLLLHPWSYTRQRSPDHRRLQGLATAMVKAIAAEHGERYRLISGASLYPAAGTLMDWAYGIRGVASFVIELRPRGG